MPFYVEYVTDHGIGRYRVEAMNFGEAVEGASRTLQDLECTRAVLRRTPHCKQAFGEGSVVARYTPTAGWRIRLVSGSYSAPESPDAGLPMK